MRHAERIVICLVYTSRKDSVTQISPLRTRWRGLPLISPIVTTFAQRSVLRVVFTFIAIVYVLVLDLRPSRILRQCHNERKDEIE